MYWLSTQVCVIQAQNKCSKCLPCACTHAVSRCLLTDSQVNDVLLHTMPDIVKTLLQLIDAVDS